MMSALTETPLGLSLPYHKSTVLQCRRTKDLEGNGYFGFAEETGVCQWDGE